MPPILPLHTPAGEEPPFLWRNLLSAEKIRVVRLCSDNTQVQIHLSSVTLSKHHGIRASFLCCEANNSTFLPELLKGSNEKKIVRGLA